MPRRILVLVGLTVLTCAAARAATFTDDFSAGLDPLVWRVTLDSLFVMDDTQGDIRFSKPHGGVDALQVAMFEYRRALFGDFDVSITFRDALIDQIDGSPGNQIQLNLHCGDQYFAVVRSDEDVGGGDNHHVYMLPPHAWYGWAPDASTSGVMRIRRTGTLVEGYIHGSLIYSAHLNADPVDELSISLQNNRTLDATSVTFDDFSLTADDVTAVGDGAVRPALLLSDAWPNPSAGASQVRLLGTTVAPVSVGILDARGRRVRELGRLEAGAGPRDLAWDGRDAAGRLVGDGVYFYAVREGTRESRRRVIIVR